MQVLVCAADTMGLLAFFPLTYEPDARHNI
jgi:hypothetical protein